MVLMQVEVITLLMQKAAGGFAGNLEGTVLGEKGNEDAGISAQNIRSVIAGEYAGGCFGIADVAGVANISAGNETSLLDKIVKAWKNRCAGCI